VCGCRDATVLVCCQRHDGSTGGTEELAPVWRGIHVVLPRVGEIRAVPGAGFQDRVRSAAPPRSSVTLPRLRRPIYLLCVAALWPSTLETLRWGLVPKLARQYGHASRR